MPNIDVATAAALLADGGITQKLAEFSSSVELDSLPDGIAESIGTLLVDHVGVAIGGLHFSESAGPLMAGLAALGGSGQGTVFGSSQRFIPAHAALANGALAHMLDFDDTNAAAALHPGAAVIPAVIATLEAEGGSGRDLLAALIAGYEVTCRVGRALGTGAYKRGFHVTAIAGVVGAAAGVARARRASADVTASAIGIACSQAAGSMQYLADGSWNKRLHPGFAAHDAIVSVALAQAGVIGAADAIEGGDGLLASYSADPHVGELLAGIGTEWRLAETALKPYPSCRLTHAAVDAAIALRDRFSPAERGRATMRVRLSSTGMAIVGDPADAKRRPRNSVDAQFSVHAQLALAWLHGTVELGQYAALDDPALLDLAQRIEARMDPSLSAAACILEVEADGHTEQWRVDIPLGEPEAPMTPSAIEAKFFGLASPVLGEGRCAAFLRQAERLDRLTSMEEMLAILRPEHIHHG